MNAQARAATERAETSAGSVSTTRESGQVPRYALVRRIVMQLIELLELERLSILIDEWSTLDPSGATAIQPEFAELLKRTFHGIPRLTVKIATNRYQTRFDNRGAAGAYRGLEIEADIFTATHLDRATLSQAELVAFYEALLLKRLAFFSSELEVFAVGRNGQPAPTFVLSIFQNRRAFEELVKGSAAVPRDFLNLFKAISKQRSHSVGERWTVAEVLDTVRQRSVGGQDTIELRSVTSQLIDPCIRETVSRTGSRIFLVRRRDHDSVGDALDELLEKRLIHDYPREELPSCARSDNRGYLIDYGLWLDWERTRATDGPTEHENALPTDGLELDRWQVDAAVIERERYIRCGSCGHVFAVDEASFVRKGLCPECFESAEPVTRGRPNRAA